MNCRAVNASNTFGSGYNLEDIEYARLHIFDAFRHGHGRKLC
jgi:hypothetical protein